MGVSGLAAAGIGAGLTSGIGGYLSSREQSDAANEALSQQLNAMAIQQRHNEIVSGRVAGDLGLAGEQAQGTLADYLNRAYSTVGAGGMDARAALETGQMRSGLGIKQGLRSALGSLGQARGDIAGGTAGAEAALTGGLTGAESALSPIARLSALSGGAASPISAYDITGAAAADPFSGFEADPGYQFRQEQGEQAINRGAAARGGRASGRTLKELAEFNQGLASQEYGNFSNRQLASRGQTLSALMNQAGRSDTAQLASKGAQLSLAGQGNQALSNIAGLRSGAGQNLAQLLYGSGQSLSGLSQAQAGYQTDAAGRLASLESQGGANLANLLQQTAGAQSGILGQTGTGLAGLLSGTGAQQANALLTGLGLQSNLTQAMMPAYNVPTQYAGQGTAAIGNSITSTLQNLMTLGAEGLYGGRGGNNLPTYRLGPQ